MTAKLVNGSPGAAGMNMRVSLNEDVTGMFDSGKFSQVVADGSFSGLSLGQCVTKQITIDGVQYTAKAYLVDANYYHAPNAGKALVTQPHVASIVVLYDSAGRPLRCQWNTEANTSGALVSSNIHTFIQTKINPAIESAFGSEHVIKHSELLSSATSNGKSSSWTWVDEILGTVPNSMQFLGCAPSGSSFDIGSRCRILAAFKFVNPWELFGNYDIWTGDIFSAQNAMLLNYYGNMHNSNASYSYVTTTLALLK